MKIVRSAKADPSKVAGPKAPVAKTSANKVGKPKATTKPTLKPEISTEPAPETKKAKTAVSDAAAQSAAITSIETMGLKDIRELVKGLNGEEFRGVVRMFENIQKQRIAASNNSTAAEKDGRPNLLASAICASLLRIEDNIEKIFKEYAKIDPVCAWMTSQRGIGARLACTIIAMIDFEKCRTAGALWRYAGLETKSLEWAEKKEGKRPFNSRLKSRLLYAVKNIIMAGKPEENFYLRLYLEYKEGLHKRNQAGDFAEDAKKSLARLKREDTVTMKANKEGRLSDGHLHNRAVRHVAQILASHLYEVGRSYNNLPVCAPYVISVLGHQGYMPPNKWPAGLARPQFIDNPGLSKATAKA